MAYLRKWSIKRIVIDGIVYVLMIAAAIMTVGPFLVMASISLTKNMRFLTFPVSLIPRPFGLDNFELLFGGTMVLRWLVNSLFCDTVATLGCLWTSSMAGYAFSRGRFRGKNVIFTAFMGVLMMPFAAVIVPLFVTLAEFKLVNTYTALIAPSFVSAFGTFFMRQAYLSIPRDYDDAARIDGANIWQIYLYVLLPQLGPPLATLAVLRFMGYWNMFLYPMIVTSRSEMRLLTVGLATVARSGGDVGLDMAGAMIGFLPTFIVFLLGQKYIIQGVSLTGVKG